MVFYHLSFYSDFAVDLHQMRNYTLNDLESNIYGFFISVYNLYLMSDSRLNYSAVPMHTVSVECWDYFGTSASSVIVFVLPNTTPTFTNLPGK